MNINVILGGSFVLVVALGFYLQSQKKDVNTVQDFKRSSRVDGAEAKALLAEGALLLDVRTIEEFNEGHLEGALHIPVAEMEARAEEVPSDRVVIVYCRSGKRSARAAQILLAHEPEREVRDLGPMSAFSR